MIITLSESFATLSAEQWLRYLPAVDNLVRTHVQGWHFFVPDRLSCQVLASHVGLNAQIRELLSVQIQERATVLQGYARSVKTKIVCLQSSEKRLPAEAEIQIELSQFSDLDNCLKSLLIVENAESDAIFYLAAAKEIHAIGSLLPALAFDIVAGGGQTTGNRIRTAVKEIRPSLAIVDGDRTHPLSPLGSTAKASKEAIAASIGPQHRLLVTDVRALENFIPFSTAHRFLSDPVTVARALKLAAWQSKEHGSSTNPAMSVTAYYGPRKGLRIKAYRTASKEFKAAIDQFCLHLGESFKVPADDDSSSDQQFAIMPLSSDYAGLFIRLINQRTFSPVLKDLMASPFYGELSSICDFILSFGAAPIKTAARAAA